MKKPGKDGTVTFIFIRWDSHIDKVGGGGGGGSDIGMIG